MYLVNLNLDSSNISPYISTTLLNWIEKQLEQWKKTILYINKRGAFSSMICSDCSYLFECHQCDSSMNVHYHPDILSCHLCWHKEPLPKTCKSCGSKNIKSVWVGTQQIEDTLGKYFSDAKIFRFDSDSMKNKTQKSEAIDNIKSADIIIGTKMITTGFDFSDIGLIWVILIEAELKIPKYNTHERVYSNITQLLWRWSRVWEKTDYIIQTYIPDNTLVQQITWWNYKQFFLDTLAERKLFSYPPFCELAILEYRHKDEKKSLDFLSKIHSKLSENIWEDIEIIMNPNTFKKHNQYHCNMIIKWKNIRDGLQTIKSDIFSNSNLSIAWG